MNEEIQAKASGSVFEEEDEQPPDEDDQEPTFSHNYGRDAAGAEDAAELQSHQETQAKFRDLASQQRKKLTND